MVTLSVISWFWGGSVYSHIDLCYLEGFFNVCLRRHHFRNVTDMSFTGQKLFLVNVNIIESMTSMFFLILHPYYSSRTAKNFFCVYQFFCIVGKSLSCLLSFTRPPFFAFFYIVFRFCIQGKK